MCYVVPAGPGLSAAVAPQPHVLVLFGDIVRGVTPMMIYLLIAELGLLAFGRAIRRSMGLWETALRGFGGHETLALPPAPFHETDALLRAFVSANNDMSWRSRSASACRVRSTNSGPRSSSSCSATSASIPPPVRSISSRSIRWRASAG